MNKAIIQNLIDNALARKITFSQILATLATEEVESYHVDFLRDEYRYYAKNGESYVTGVPLIHDTVAHEFFTEKLQDINHRVQTGQAGYPDFVKEGAAACCAYYIVYVNGRKVLYFGRNGDEYIQNLPAQR